MNGYLDLESLGSYATQTRFMYAFKTRLARFVLSHKKSKSILIRSKPIFIFV